MSVQAAPPLEKARKPPAAAVYEVVVPLLATAAVFLLWEGICQIFKVPAYLVPAPSQVWTDTMAIGPAVLGHTMATLKTVMLGFAFSIVVSLPLAVLLTASPAIASAIYPFLVWTQSIPKVALAPILVVVLGSNELPRVVITVLVAFFPLVISMATGLMSVPPELIELSRACRASQMERALAHPPALRDPLHLRRPQGRGLALRCRRRSGGIRQCRRRPGLSHRHLDRLLQGTRGLRRPHHSVGHGRRAVPDRGDR